MIIKYSLTEINILFIYKFKTLNKKIIIIILYLFEYLGNKILFFKYETKIIINQ